VPHATGTCPIVALAGLRQDGRVSNAPDDPVADRRWFSVRCIFRGDDDTPTSYEERITVWRAMSFEEAIALAEAEAGDYAELVGSRYLGLAQAYHLFDEIGHGVEVYSLIRDSNLPPDAYLSTFFDTRWERQGTLGAPPADQPVQPESTATARVRRDCGEPPQAS
jgi:hypothetical protein